MSEILEQTVAELVGQVAALGGLPARVGELEASQTDVVAANALSINSQGQVETPTSTLPTPLATIVAAPTGITAIDTANATAAFATATNGTVRFRAGTYLLDDVVVGSLAAGAGKQLRILGAGAGATILKPGGAGRVLDIKGPGDSTSAYLNISDLTLGHAIGDVGDFAYDHPLLQITGYQNARFERFKGRLNGTGTLIKLDSTFNSSFCQGSIITGRYGVPFEFDDSAGGEPQMDTVLLEQLVVTGVYGAIFRNIKNGLGTLRLDGYKTVIEGGPDRETRAIGKLAAEAPAGTETLTLEVGQGANYAVGDPVFIGFGEKAETNKITEIAGDVLTLRWPLRYAHNPASGTGFQGQVISHGVALSIASNTQLLELRSCHLEGAATSIVMDEAVNVLIDNCLGVYQDFLYLVGALQDLRIGGVHAQGSLVNAVNNLVTVPAANNSGIARLQVLGPITKTAGQPEVVVLNDPGANLKTRLTDIIEKIEGVPRRTWNVPPGSGAAIVERTSENGTVTYTRTYAGVQTIVTGATALTLKQSAEGVETSPGILFENKAAVPKHMLLYQSAPAKIGIQDSTNTKQLQFDVAGVKVIYGSAEDSSWGRLEAKVMGTADSAVKIAKGLGVFNHAPPAAQHAAIASPAAELAALKTAVDLLREVLKEYGLTA
jgi:hypothetical protein